ncbi:MAG TPA: HAD family phosphatase [Woeseiaceae bacterium]|nr:HAD family phosphatase [Woeseiaceae bacterium]
MTLQLPPGIEAVFFDMDGTLIDSEGLTEAAVEQLLAERDLPLPAFSLAAFHGMTWKKIEQELVALYPVLAGHALADRLQHTVDERMRRDMPLPIPGAVEAFLAASRACIAGIVSSSPRETIAFVADRLGLTQACRVLVGAEDIKNSKPHPECYRLAATRAGIPAGRSLVFEDSAAGVCAAKEAGAFVVGVRGRRDDADVAHLSSGSEYVIADYRDLPDDFFTRKAS